MKRILRGMIDTMNAVRPPRMTALKELHEAEAMTASSASSSAGVASVGSGSSRRPFAILIGTILSARTKDENTTKVVKKLLAKYNSPEALANAKLTDVERIIRPIGFYHVKAKRIIGVASIINSQYKGMIPDDLDRLVSLPGVGRKTANCVLVYAYEKPAIPVDVHVHRISNRLGLVETKTPEQTEFELMKKIPKKYWLEINDTFVMYGQNICKPISPMCEVCRIKGDCKYYKTMKKKGKGKRISS